MCRRVDFTVLGLGRFEELPEDEPDSSEVWGPSRKGLAFPSRSCCHLVDVYGYIRAQLCQEKA